MSQNDTLPDWGRVVIAGGTDWQNLGRKPPGGKVASPDAPDLPDPHILRDVANQKMKRVFSGHSACHAVFINTRGEAFVLGRNEHGQCGVPIQADAGEPKGTTGPVISVPVKLLRSRHFTPELPRGPDGEIVHVACGRNHTILVTRGGQAYAAGANALGQCGNADTIDLQGFRKIEGAPFIKEKDPVVQAGAGVTFSLVLTASGKVYAMGSSEKGQMGNGKTGEHFVTSNKLAFNTFTEPILVRAISDKKIVQISCGQQHAIAMDEEGFCYVWGFGGYGRLGLGQQTDMLTPTLVPQFARDNQLTRAEQVIAGPTNTVVIDRQRMYWLAGKWKTSGDGGAGQGFMTFKYLPDLMGCKMQRAALGGVTLICTADEEATARGPHEATMNICWGQNATYGELGLGVDKPRSATKPQRCETLDGISIIDLAAGQNTTYYIARNLGDNYAELPRFPELVESSDVCQVCQSEKSKTGDDERDVLLECERCEHPYHLQCLDPPLDAVPEGEWQCPVCVEDGEASEDADAQAASKKKGQKNGSATAAPASSNKKRGAGTIQEEAKPKKKGKK